MAVKQIGTVTIAGVTFDGVTSISFDADNGITYRRIKDPKGFAKCVVKTEQSRTMNFEVEDYDDSIALPFCGGNAVVSVQLLGDCGGANNTWSGTARMSDLQLNESENGEIKTASVTATFFDTVDGATEPITLVTV